MNKRHKTNVTIARRGRRAGALVGIATLALSVASAASAAQAQPSSWSSQARSFDIPAQDIQGSVVTFGRQSGVQLVLDPAVVHIKTAALSGMLTPSVALRRLIGKAPLEAEWSGPNTLVIRRASSVHARAQSIALVEPAPSVAFPAAEESTQRPVASDDIVVTARRVEERLQDVPVSITAIGERKLQEADVRDYHDTLKLVPSVQTFTALEGNVNTVGFTRVRAVQGLATYFADAPSNKFPFYAPFFDVNNVQVLKGPQGTLFGEASNAGAELINPVRPGEKAGGYVLATVGELSRKSIEGAIDIPLVSDRVLFRLAAKSFYRDGYVKDILSGYRFGGQDFWIVRPSMILRPTDNIESYTMFEVQHAKGFGQWAATIGVFNFSSPAQVPIIATQAALNGMTLSQFNAARDQILAQQIALGPYKINGWSTGCRATATSPATASTVPGAAGLAVTPQPCPPDGGEREDYQIVNNTSWTINDNLTLKNIFSYTWGSERALTIEGDMTRLVLRENNPKSSIWRPIDPLYSDELQLSGKVGVVDFVGGVFARRTWSKPDIYRPFYSTYQTSFTDTASISATSSENKSAYAHANVDLGGLMSGLIASGGVRYSRDHVTNKSTRVLLDAQGMPTGQLGIVSGGPGTLAGDAVFTAVSYDASLQYHFNRDTMIYISDAKGYSSGGLQAITGIERFQPDSLNNLEIGLKSATNIGDWRARTAITAYYGWLSNAKVSSVSLSTNPVTGATGFVAGVQNAAAVRIHGFEAEFGLSRQNFSINGFLSYSGAKYERYPSINTVTLQPIDLSSSPFPGTPKWKGGLGAKYTLPLDRARFGEFSIGADFSFASQYWSSVSKPLTPLDPNDRNTGAICTEQRTAANGFGPLSADGGKVWVQCLPARQTVDLNLAWKEPLGLQNLELGLTVTNLTKWVGPISHGPYWDSLAFDNNVPEPPRTAFLSIRYSM